MANIVESYPLLKDETINNIFLSNEFIVTYLKDDKDKRLDVEEIEEDSFDYLIKNPDGEWSLDKYNLNISGTLKLQNVNALFDGTTDKIVEKDTVIGISLNAFSRISKVNKIKCIGEFKYGETDNLDFQYSINFDAKQLSEKLYIDFELFVKEANNVSSIYSNKIGSKLGIFNEIILELEGTGSIFPIKNFNDPKMPLWLMDINIDSYDDEFSSKTVCLKINTAHKDYSSIGSEDITLENSHVWKEILSNFLENILIYISSDFESIKNSTGFKEGSVGLFLKYVIEVFNIDASDLEYIPNLSMKIRNVLDTRI